MGYLNTPKIHTETFFLPYLPKHTSYWVIYMSRNGEKSSTSHHLEGKSKLGTFYPPNVYWYTSFYIGKISKSLTNEFNSVNDEILWNPISQIGKIIAFTTNMYFYPKNVLVSMITGVWKSKNSNIFILNSVNGGQSFLSKTNYDFFYSKLHPREQRRSSYKLLLDRTSTKATIIWIY